MVMDPTGGDLPQDIWIKERGAAPSPGYLFQYLFTWVLEGLKGMKVILSSYFMVTQLAKRIGQVTKTLSLGSPVPQGTCIITHTVCKYQKLSQLGLLSIFL